MEAGNGRVATSQDALRKPRLQHVQRDVDLTREATDDGIGHGLTSVATSVAHYANVAAAKQVGDRRLD